MKRIISVVLVAAMAMSILCACDEKTSDLSGGKEVSATEKAYELSASAFVDVYTSYVLINQIGGDICSVWSMASQNTSKLTKWGEAFDFFCDNVSLTRDQVYDAMAYLMEKNENLGFDYYKDAVRNSSDLYFTHEDYLPKYYDSTIMMCVDIVITVYIQNGFYAKIDENIESAKKAIRELSENYSDYEHYPVIKELFTTVNTYYNFCCSPSGNLNEVAGDIEEYNDTVDRCYNSLYYFFENVSETEQTT